jgi:gamma-glutamylputrescine oxidase
LYDPLVHPIPGVGAPHTSSYWADTAGAAPADDGPVTTPMDVDVAIIGGGYTGLSCALHLAREHGIKAVVLEANQTAWGCSGRNGSFARISGGRVPLATLIERYGRDTARSYFMEMQAALTTVRTLIRDDNIACDAQPDGVYKVATHPDHMGKLESEAYLFRDVLDYPARIVNAEEARQAHAGAESFGALYLPDGFAMHPLKLARGLQKIARNAGATVHTASPVTSWSTGPSGHRLTTRGGIVTARRVVAATNGYTSSQLHSVLAGRVLPVHSQIIVTRPMRADEKRESLRGSECMFDTRNLLFYYRRLPDDRILFGGRSAVYGKDAENPKHCKRLHEALCRKFPVLKGIEVDYNWGGWVAVTQSSLPFICSVPGVKDAFTAGGYAGSGVSFSMQAGKRLAEMVAGNDRPTSVDFLHQIPERFPFRPFLRIGQRIAYAWYRSKDAR